MPVSRLIHLLNGTIFPSPLSKSPPPQSQVSQRDFSTADSLFVDVLEDRMMLSTVVQADYHDDFQVGNPTSGWQYLWNAPSDWNGTSSADSTDHRFGNPEHYVSLQTSGDSYRPAGDATINLNEPSRKLRLSKTGGRVGAGFQQNGNSNNRITRNAIAAWTVQEDGFYAIRNSTFSTNIESKGIDVVIHVNNDDAIFRRRLAGVNKNFNTNLGHLQAGDVVYVGFGGGTNDQRGVFRHDFSIVTIESPGITIKQTDGLTQVSEPGTSDTFSVVLNSKPVTGQRVTINISVDDSGELSTNRRRLFFNRSNWNVPQTVTVSGVDDSLYDGTTFTKITASIDQTRSNPEYHSVADQSLVAANFDNENLIPLSSQIASGIVRGLNRIVVTPGEYQLNPANDLAAHLYISWAEDVEIIADDVTILATDLNTGILLRESSDVSLQGLTIDYATLPFTQATVTQIGDDRSWVDVVIHDGYELLSDGDTTRLVAHDRNTLLVKPKTASRHGATATALGGRSFRINSFRAYDTLRTGDYVSLTRPINTPHAVWVDQGENIRLEDITVNASTSFAFFETQSSGNEYVNLTVTPGERPEGATVDRLLSSNYDGFHSKNAKVGPRISRSRFFATGDDGIAINGDYTFLARNDGDSIVVASKWRLTRFEVGDRIRVFSETTGHVSEATVTGVTPYNEPDIDFESLRDLWLPNLQHPQHQFRDGYRLTLSNALPNVVGDLISNIDRNGTGYEIRDNVVENTRARGFVLKSPEGIVEGNRLEHIAVTGILLSPEAQYWAEGDFSPDVQIRNNHLSNVGFFHSDPNRRAGGGIAIVADTERTVRGHQNITIENNLLERIEGPTITLSNAENVQIRSNWFREINQTDHGYGQGSAVWIDNSSQVLLEDNVIDNPGDFLAWPLTVTPTVSAVNDVNAFLSVNQSAAVVNHGVAYRGATGLDEFEIDSSIEALLPGQNPSESNISNYSRGLNRIIIDLRDFLRTDLTLADFEFLVGNSADPNQWQVLHSESEIELPNISIIDGPSTGFTRVVLDWDDYAIRDSWLQVTIKANGNTGLSEDHTFYFGNLVGNSVNENLSPGSLAEVNHDDISHVVENFGATNATNNQFDFDRDGKVDGFDAALSRIRFSNRLTMFAAPISQTTGIQLQFVEPSAEPTLISPDLLSGVQRRYIRSILDRWESRLAGELSVVEQNTQLTGWQSDFAELHSERATLLESQGRFNSSKYWSLIALAEREIANEAASQPNVDFFEIARRWTV